jgi:hypothetical protein
MSDSFLITCAHFVQLLLRSKTMYFAEGTILGGSNDKATGLMVITSGQVSKIPQTCK